MTEQEREVVIRALLPLVQDGDEVACVLRDRLLEDVKRDAARLAELDKVGEEAAEELLPLLEQAREEGTYVRSGHVWSPDEHVRRGCVWVPGPLDSRTPGRVGAHVATAAPGRLGQSFYWAGAARILARRGLVLQNVGHEGMGEWIDPKRDGEQVRSRSFTNDGYRLAPEGQDERSVTTKQVYREAGRCEYCGIRPTQRGEFGCVGGPGRNGIGMARHHFDPAFT